MGVVITVLETAIQNNLISSPYPFEVTDINRVRRDSSVLSSSSAEY
jgi:hypothetical protein